jgi:hypothetical protein
VNILAHPQIDGNQVDNSTFAQNAVAGVGATVQLEIICGGSRTIIPVQIAEIGLTIAAAVVGNQGQRVQIGLLPAKGRLDTSAPNVGITHYGLNLTNGKSQ